MASIIKLDTIQSTTGASALTIDGSGNVTANGNINLSGNVTVLSQKPIHIIELATPTIIQFSYSSTVYSSFTATTVPSNSRYLLADIFITASISDHQNFEFGREAITAQKNWVDTRGQIPTGQFGNNARHVITCTYNGETDGYSPNYGLWYNSQLVPTSGQTIYYGNYGNSGSTGYVYVRVRGYSL